MTKEALKLALEALTHGGSRAMGQSAVTSHTKAITAIKEALAQPEQEPVVYQCPRCATSMQVDLTAKAALAQPEQEPVAWGFRDHDGVIYDCISPEAHADCEGEYNVPLYDAPPKRPWVGLTTQEAADCWTTSATKTWNNFESALRSKNT